jgi:hypothetical protein
MLLCCFLQSLVDDGVVDYVFGVSALSKSRGFVLVVMLKGVYGREVEVTRGLFWRTCRINKPR